MALYQNVEGVLKTMALYQNVNGVIKTISENGFKCTTYELSNFKTQQTVSIEGIVYGKFEIVSASTDWTTGNASGVTGYYTLTAQPTTSLIESGENIIRFTATQTYKSASSGVTNTAKYDASFTVTVNNNSILVPALTCNGRTLTATCQLLIYN